MSQAKRVLVTGASRGIGRALVEHFTDNEWQTVGCSRHESDFSHERYLHVTADVTDEQQVRGLFKRVRGELGGLDALINNAGLGRMLPIALTPVETAQRIMDVNVIGTFLLTRTAMRLLKNSDCARIVNLSSIAVPLRLEGEAVYAASKAAVESLTRIAAKELGAMQITCNSIGPTPILTDLTRNVPREKLDSLVARQAIRKWATFDDVINVVDFFLRPASSMITGQVVYLGGIS